MAPREKHKRSTIYDPRSLISTTHNRNCSSQGVQSAAWATHDKADENLCLSAAGVFPRWHIARMPGEDPTADWSDTLPLSLSLSLALPFIWAMCARIVHIPGTRNWRHRSMSWARPLLHAPATGTGNIQHTGNTSTGNPLGPLAHLAPLAAADAVIFCAGTDLVAQYDASLWCPPWFMIPFISVDRPSCWRWRNLFSFMYFWYAHPRPQLA